MKKFLKNNIKLILVFLLGIVISSGITAYAVNNYMSEQIRYQNNTFAINSVSEALDDLYSYSKEKIDNYTSNNYSTEEQVVGTWIDGKPIYQLTGTITSGIIKPGTTTLISNFVSTHNLSEFIGYSTTSAYNSGSQGQIDAFGNGSANISVDSNDLNLYMPSTSATIDKITYTIQYTKTTDTATS